jgi:hypothetical protein
MFRRMVARLKRGAAWDTIITGTAHTVAGDAL